MNNKERCLHIKCLILQADTLMFEYEQKDKYQFDLEEVIEAINCRIEKLSNRAS